MILELDIVESDIPDPAPKVKGCCSLVPVVRIKRVHQGSRFVIEDVPICED